MKKSISPTVTVIVIILVIVIAGLLWYVFSTPRQQKQGELNPPMPTLRIPVKATPAEKAALEEARVKAAIAERKLRVEAAKTAKPGAAAQPGAAAAKPGEAAKPGAPAPKPAAPAAPSPTPGR